MADGRWADDAVDRLGFIGINPITPWLSPHQTDLHGSGPSWAANSIRSENKTESPLNRFLSLSLSLSLSVLSLSVGSVCLCVSLSLTVSFDTRRMTLDDLG